MYEEQDRIHIDTGRPLALSSPECPTSGSIPEYPVIVNKFWAVTYKRACWRGNLVNSFLKSYPRVIFLQAKIVTILYIDIEIYCQFVCVPEVRRGSLLDVPSPCQRSKISVV